MPLSLLLGGSTSVIHVDQQVQEGIDDAPDGGLGQIKDSE